MSTNRETRLGFTRLRKGASESEYASDIYLTLYLLLDLSQHIELVSNAKLLFNAKRVAYNDAQRQRSTLNDQLSIKTIKKATVLPGPCWPARV